LLIVVNETAIPAREAATTELHANDVVTLLPPIAGG
jgi:sulfur carrier protein ThiS